MKILLILFLAVLLFGRDSTYTDSQLDFKAKYSAPFTPNKKVIDGDLNGNHISLNAPVYSYQHKEVYTQDFKYGPWKKVKADWHTNSCRVKSKHPFGKKYKVILKGY